MATKLLAFPHGRKKMIKIHHYLLILFSKKKQKRKQNKMILKSFIMHMKIFDF